MNEIQPEGNYYDKYSSKNIIERKMMSSFFKTVRSVLGYTENISSVYDAGCGEGHFTSFVRSCFPKASITATDISETVIAKASEDYKELAINFEQRNIYELDTAQKYNLITCSEVMEHLEEPEKVLKEFEAMTDGYVLITVPNEPIWRILNMCRFKYLRRLGNTPGHIQHWNKRKFLKMVSENCGLQAVKSAKSLPWLIFLFKKVR